MNFVHSSSFLHHREIEFFALFGRVAFGIEEFVSDIESDERRVLHLADQQERIALAHQNERFFEETRLAIRKRGAIKAGLQRESFERINISDVKPDETFER